MSEGAGRVVRQWVSMPGGSCDLRVGEGAVEAMGAVLKGAVGRPHLCALVMGADSPIDAVERVRRQLTDAGFEVRSINLARVPEPRTLAGVEALSAELAEAGVTADDLACAVGGGDLLSLCSFVCSSWCGGMPLVHVPCDLLAAVEVSTTPRALDVGDASRMMAPRVGAKYEVCDLGLVAEDPSREGALHARALMAAAALCDAEAAVQRLWDRAELLAAGDAEALQDQLADTAKSRGHIISSTSVAVRQSITFGQPFMWAASGLLGPSVSRGLLLAEGLRFQARIAAAQELCSVDDVLTIDELLDLLGLEPVTCELEGARLAEALKAERFQRSNRMNLSLPRAIGRVRPGAVDDATLLEHAEAWCASRSGA